MATVVGVGVDEVGVPKEKVGAGLSWVGFDAEGVPKLNVVSAGFGVAAGLGGCSVAAFGGSILPKPASLMGLLIRAEMPVILGSSTLGAGSGSGFLGTGSTGFGASTVSLVGGGSSSKSSLRQLSRSDSLFFSTRFSESLSLLTIGDFSFGLMKLIRPPSSSSSSCSGSGSSRDTGRICDSSYFLLNSVIRGCVGCGLTG